MSSDLLQKMMASADIRNAANIEKAREELAGAITRVLVNEALRDAKAQSLKAQEIKGGNDSESA